MSVLLSVALQLLGKQLAEREYRAEINVEDAIPLGVLDVDQLVGGGDAGAVCQNIGTADELLDLLHRLCDRCGGNGIHTDRIGFHTVGIRNFLCRFNQKWLVDIHHDDVGAALCKFGGNCLADATRRTGNDTDFTLEILHDKNSFDFIE